LHLVGFYYKNISKEHSEICVPEPLTMNLCPTSVKLTWQIHNVFRVVFGRL